MIDRFISLAFSVQSNKGVYALLLASGISRAAQIPTGWEVVEDLIRKIARLREQECEGDPAGWYTETFGVAANYSDLLVDVAKEPAERAHLLRGYFEATAEERERGLKVLTKAHKAIARLVSDHFPVQAAFTPDALAARLKPYEALTEILRAIVATGCYWGSKEQAALRVKVLDRVSNPYGLPMAGYDAWTNLRLYPALLLLYTGGLAAIAAGNYATFLALLTEPKVRVPNGEHVLIDRVHAIAVTDHRAMQGLPGLERHKTPTSDHLFQVLREVLREFLPDDLAYEVSFDRFEYMLALVYSDLSNGAWGPVGCFLWRDHLANPEARVAGRIKKEANAAGQDWPPLRADLFKGSIERFNQVQALFDKHVAAVEAQSAFA